MRVLVIEHQFQLAHHISAALLQSGHSPTVAHDGAAGLQACCDEAPDIIILDLNLPSAEGVSMLAQLRERKLSSRVMILAESSDLEQPMGEWSVGDHLTKPIEMEELIGRVEALARCHVTNESTSVLHVADLVLDLRTRQVVRSGEAVALSLRELTVLEVLMSAPGRIFSRSELCLRLWKQEPEYLSGIIDTFIERLHKKLDTGHAFALIHTVRDGHYTLSQTAPPSTK